MTLTAEQIAEKVFPMTSVGPTPSWNKALVEQSNKRIKEKRDELTSLIRDLQKQTWDQACDDMQFKIVKELTMQGDEDQAKAAGLIKFPPFPSNL